MQVLSLTYRNRYSEAFGFGLDSLRELGITIPAADRLPAELDSQFNVLYRWLDRTDAADDLARPELTDPTLLAASRLIQPVLSVAYFVADLEMHAWLSLEALRIWLEHGPGRTLLGPTSHAAIANVELRGDYAAALDHQFDYLYRWLDHTDAADDLTRPELTDPTLLAVTRLTEAVMTGVAG